MLDRAASAGRQVEAVRPLGHSSLPAANIHVVTCRVTQTQMPSNLRLFDFQAEGHHVAIVDLE